VRAYGVGVQHTAMGLYRGPMSTAYRAYRALPGPVRALADRVLRIRAEREVTSLLPDWGEAQSRLVIGPLNTAGQAYRWARAAEQHLGAQALSVRAKPRTGTGLFRYPTDVELSAAAQVRGMAPFRDLVLAGTHVLSEGGRAVLDDVHHRSLLSDLPELVAAGVRPAVLIHGSEARDLRVHAERYLASPFAQPWDERFTRMQARVEQTQEVLHQLCEHELPIFVATPDMLEHVPGATWLPIVVDVAAFATDTPPLVRDRPVVLHAPTNPRLKGTAIIEQVLGRLESAGRIEYRQLQGVPNGRMPEAIAAADVVVDQVVLGNPATLLCETMAAGRLAVAHISPDVRAAIRTSDPQGEDIPVIEADADGLAAAMEQILTDRDAAAALASRGPAWVARNHDGERSARVLAAGLVGL
jgi:hypothetical protein